MNKADLDKMTKEELMEAIERVDELHYCLRRGTLIRYILDAVSDIRRQKAYNNARKAEDDAIKAMNAYFNWQKRAIQDYGDGESVVIMDLPKEFIAEGEELSRAWEEAEEKRKKANKVEDDIYMKLLK